MMIKELNKKIEELYGERCKDFESTCTVCQVWNTYDNLIDALLIEHDDYCNIHIGHRECDCFVENENSEVINKINKK